MSVTLHPPTRLGLRLRKPTDRRVADRKLRSSVLGGRRAELLHLLRLKPPRGAANSPSATRLCRSELLHFCIEVKQSATGKMKTPYLAIGR